MASVNGVAEETVTVEVAATTDWGLIVYTNHYNYVTDLPATLASRIRTAVWARQDGYGEPGFMPAQRWDWSGIRDSSEAATWHMAARVRELLRQAGRTTFVATKRSY